MATNAAMRRLNRLLSDEEFGPKLARLRGEDERRILTLVEENRGKEARAAILQADEKRREVQREKRSGQQRAKRERRFVASREQRENAAVANIMRQYGRRASETSVMRNVGYMTLAELEFATDASEQELMSRSRETPEHEDSRGKPINPFWYH